MAMDFQRSNKMHTTGKQDVSKNSTIITCYAMHYSVQQKLCALLMNLGGGGVILT